MPPRRSAGYLKLPGRGIQADVLSWEIPGTAVAQHGVVPPGHATTQNKETRYVQTVTALLASAGIAFASVAGAQMTKQAYDAEVSKLDAVHKADRERCDALAGNQKDICQAQARRSVTSPRRTSRLRTRTLRMRAATPA